MSSQEYGFMSEDERRYAETFGARFAAIERRAAELGNPSLSSWVRAARVCLSESRDTATRRVLCSMLDLHDWETWDLDSNYQTCGRCNMTATRVP